MKRTFSILTLAALAGLMLGSRATAAPPAHAMAVQTAAHAVAHPGRHYQGSRHHGSNYQYYGHSRRSYLHPAPVYRSPYRGPVVVPAYPPVIVAPQYYQPYYPPYYGPQGGVMLQGRNWGFGFGF